MRRFNNGNVLLHVHTYTRALFLLIVGNSSFLRRHTQSANLDDGDPRCFLFARYPAPGCRADTSRTIGGPLVSSNTSHRAAHKFIINEQSITPGFVALVRREGIIAPPVPRPPLRPPPPVDAGNYDINNKYLCKRTPLYVKSAFAICI